MTNPGARWYEDSYRLRNVVDSAAVGWNHNQFLADRRPPIGRLLDVGCGTGNFLAVARDRGYTVTGLDFDEVAVRSARDRLRIEDIHAWTLGDFIERRPGEAFDVVTAFEIVEHLERPREFLRQCVSLIRPGGFMAVSVPFRDRWPKWRYDWDEPPNHLSRWSKRALIAALTQADLQVVDVRTGWMAGASTMMGLVRLGIALSCLRHAQREGDETRRRLERRAARLHRLKTAAFELVGAPVDVVLRAAGATGVEHHAIATRQK